MKILVYSYRMDEAKYLDKFSKKYNVEIELCKEGPTLENANLASGFNCISIITTPVDRNLIKKFYEVGVRFISTRTIGYDHIDIKSAREFGIHVGNVTYSPNSVADYTIMMILMISRKIKTIMERSNVQDYSLKGVQGKELQNLTVGIIGTGRIGKTVIKHLSGFDCKMLAYDIYKDKKLNQYVEYVNLKELFQKSNIITMHVPATKDNYHIIDKNSITLMKEGVFIINTARGSLINTDDLIDGIEKKKIGGVALDVIENESNIYYNDLKCQVLDNRDLAILKSYPNVIVTPHTAFYTDQAVSDMVENSILSCILFVEKKENPWEVC
ncbi:lactate dehydrogenase [Clostridium tyrobutyricum]|jgi:lactate dehydrogenase-like 2-hydroxyacid dehydrogenase|uniref:D-lactate dehydrogenase n=1 Tax=Clostridium tyrobutyricum DIVETGP TaxID=1408889 RepID=W6N892_CLOTY|nr:D-isomer specific 2-hydroxyacid dehydrogenase family protein [Clostridium tyrobutyricum]AND84682.1 alpha-keto acid dehydrogenase [Clostridium tyrobutyricum]ANP69281.1 lactate dehydrogenase [Clostridium tyrobutyricum]MBV4416613.1 lactate dehydrogenase [Clostridium tyrobutyricum]MBV4421260.1 lactate dehydrogenase [Clostridium tyrobutyricum]MBV4426321.1 lactate dehydrogenase [Clostridium tyrobutyricum]